MAYLETRLRSPPECARSQAKYPWKEELGSHLEVHINQISRESSSCVFRVLVGVGRCEHWSMVQMAPQCEYWPRVLVVGWLGRFTTVIMVGKC